VPEPTRSADQPVRHVRGLNPLAEADMAVLTAISDPRWMIAGVRNRDLVAVLYPTVTEDPAERRRRSARVTRLIRILRGHGLLEKIAGTHRYQVGPEARTRLQALLACQNANPDKLITKGVTRLPLILWPTDFTRPVRTGRRRHIVFVAPAQFGIPDTHPSDCSYGPLADATRRLLRPTSTTYLRVPFDP
jgi:hypothetical protein